MSRRSDQREAITETLAAHVLGNGLGETSLRQLAKAANVSDRMLLYYFEDKADLLSAVLGLIADNFTVHLDSALPAEEPMDVKDLFNAVSNLNNHPDVRHFISLWIETIAAAARDIEPHKSIAKQIAGRFLDWIECRLPIRPSRRSDAIMLLSIIEGLAIMVVCTDTETQASAETSLDHLLELYR